jgi:hypothetical protein
LSQKKVGKSQKKWNKVQKSVVSSLKATTASTDYKGQLRLNTNNNSIYLSLEKLPLSVDIMKGKGYVWESPQ